MKAISIQYYIFRRIAFVVESCVNAIFCVKNKQQTSQYSQLILNSSNYSNSFNSKLIESVCLLLMDAYRIHRD